MSASKIILRKLMCGNSGEWFPNIGNIMIAKGIEALKMPQAYFNMKITFALPRPIPSCSLCSHAVSETKV